MKASPAARSEAEPAAATPRAGRGAALTPPGGAAHAPTIQAKLTIGAVDDPLEREADRVADLVMRMPAVRGAAADELSRAPSRLQRKCAACAEDEKTMVRPKPAGSSAGPSAEAPAPASVAAALGQPGQRLDPATRAFFEPRFGRALDDVRVHTGAAAARSATAIGGRAYTARNHIVFAAGEFAPGTTAGRSLLAHELAHVVQQSDGRPQSDRVQRKASAAPSPAVERGSPGPSRVVPGTVETQAAQASAKRSSAPAPGIEAALRARDEPGSVLPDGVRRLLEPRLGAELGRVGVFSRAALAGAAPDPGGEAEAGRAARQAVAGRPSAAASVDLGAVRIHTGPSAAASARALDARAYALGRDVMFAAGEYAPDTAAGFHLLAHEVAHVLQQGRDRRPRLQRFEARVHESAERVGLTGAGLTNEEASAVYFGNWMRDMNQVLVPVVKNLLPDDVVFALISYLAAKKFGRELTPEQFGYYIPSEHIDNPGGLVASDDLRPQQPAVSAAARPVGESRLGPSRPPALDTPQEDVSPASGTVLGANIFAVDQTGVMAYIRRSNLHVERRLELAARGGRTPEGMHHFGAAMHAIEDLFAHSNYVEICVDQLLRNDATFLAGLTGGARNVFTYSGRVGGRAVLTTGTFTGSDTQVSIASEVVGMLSRPLPPPATDGERRAQERFMVTLLRAFETQLRSNPALRQTIRSALTQGGVPGFAADAALQLPLSELYGLTTILGIPIPDWVRENIQAPIRNAVSARVLQPAAGQLQAESLDARIADTSLLRFLDDNLRRQGGQFTAAELQAMETKERLGGAPRARQQSEAQAEAARHVGALQATPVAVLAGPSHSQIAKDHANSPFHGIAFRLATVAVRQMTDAMMAAWNERAGAPTTSFDFGPASSHWPPPAAPPAGATPAEAAAFTQARNEARDLYQAGASPRATAMAESLQRGRDVVGQGGVPGQAFDLAAMRAQAASRVRAVAQILRTLAATPAQVQSLITTVDALTGRLAPEIHRRIAEQLRQAAQAAGAAAASQPVADLNAVGSGLDAAATQIETARALAAREAANAALVGQRDAALAALARTPTASGALATGLLVVLDGEIQATAVAYTAQQRAVLEGRAAAPGVPGPRPLGTATINLPAIASGSPATDRLLQESRRILAHPLENRWWEPIVRDYATRFPDRLMNDIEARNEGVPFYRGAGMPGSGHP